MNFNSKHILATNILYIVTIMKLMAMWRNDKEVQYAEETVQCTQFWDETYLSYSIPPWIPIFMPSRINTCAIFTLLSTAVNYRCWRALQTACLFIFRANQMFKIIWVPISGCGSFTVCLMLSYFFSRSSHLTGNFLNLIRTLSPIPTYTSQKTVSFYHNHGNVDLTSLATKENGVWPTHITALFTTHYLKAVISTHTKNMDEMVTSLQTSHYGHLYRSH
jgi:hypothetical protein